MQCRNFGVHFYPMERIHFANEVTPRELPSEEPYRSVAYPQREHRGQDDRVMWINE